MSRLSPITVGLLVLATVVFAVALYFVVRPGASTVTATVEEVVVEPLRPAPTPPAARLPPRPPTIARRPLTPPVTAPPAPPPPAASAPGPVDAATGAPDRDARAGVESIAGPLGRRRLFMALQKHRFLPEADERVFETLKLPETARAAIRKANDDYRRQAQTVGSAAGEGGTTVFEAAEQARRAAIDGVLGADAAKEFYASEFTALRSARRQSRPSTDEGQPATPTVTPAAPTGGAPTQTGEGSIQTGEGSAQTAPPAPPPAPPQEPAPAPAP